MRNLDLKIQSCIIFLLSFTAQIFGQSAERFDFSVNFELTKHLTRTDTPYQVCAVISFKNLNHSTIEIPREIQFGWDSTDPFTLQAFDLSDNEIDIKCNCEYDYLFSGDFIKLDKGDTLRQIINSDLFLFRTKGTFKLRVQFQPKNLFLKEGKLDGPVIYSNWDTISVR